MTRMDLSRFKTWAEEHDAEIEEFEKEDPISGYTRNITRAVFSRMDESSRKDNGDFGYRATDYVEVNEHVDIWSAEAVDVLTLVQEEWVDPGQQEYSKKEVSRAGQNGGNLQMDTFGGLKFRETGVNGQVRQVTVKV